MTIKLTQLSIYLARPRKWWAGLTYGWNRINSHPAPRTLLAGTVLLVAFITLLGQVQFSTPNLVGTDGYFHIKYAYLMRTEGLRLAFPWLPLTILNPREFFDHHFLFHVALIPFTFGDLLLGAKWASVIFPTFAFLIIWWLLHSQRVSYSGLWAMGLLAVSEAFIYRMSMPRVQSLSLGILALGLHWLLTQKYARLLPLAFVYVWLYDAFPLLLLIAGIYVLVRWHIDHHLNIRPIFYVALGIVLGLVVNPYFPFNIIFIYRHFLPKLIAPISVSVGSEWYPYKTTQLLENSPLALVAFISGAYALGLNGRRMDTRTATSFFVAILFGLMLFQSRRFIEYFPAFAMIFAAIAWTPLLRDQSKGNIPVPKAVTSIGLRSNHLSAQFLSRWVRIGILFLILGFGLSITFRASKSSVQRSKPYSRYDQAAAWLKDNTPTGSRVFQTDWDDFPRLFFYNTHNTYLIGLDPTYMQLYDADLYDLWVKITQGEVENPSEYIYPSFGATYVITDLNHKKFIQRAENDPMLNEVFRDEDAVIFQVFQ